MFKSKPFIWLVFIVSLFSIFAFEDVNKPKATIKIATGSMLGGYYFVGLKICKYISEANEGIRCEVIPTKGSVQNINLLRNGEVDFALVQSDIALSARNSQGFFAAAKPFSDIVQILRLYNEALTIIVKDKDKIRVFGDLDGKKIANGSVNSGTALVYNSLISKYDFKDPPEDEDVPREKYAQKLCNGEIDALIMVTGNPSSLVNYITHTCATNFVSVENDKIQSLIKINPAFKKCLVDGRNYPGVTNVEQTICTEAILVSKASVSKEVVGNLLAYLRNRIKPFKASNPLLESVDDDYFTSEFILPGLELN
jgi:TRAP transporter TAXI family solute receptor